MMKALGTALWSPPTGVCDEGAKRMAYAFNCRGELKQCKYCKQVVCEYHGPVNNSGEGGFLSSQARKNGRAYGGHAGCDGRDAGEEDLTKVGATAGMLQRANASMRSFLEELDMAKFSDALLGLGFTKPEDLEHLTSEEMDKINMGTGYQKRLDEKLKRLGTGGLPDSSFRRRSFGSASTQGSFISGMQSADNIRQISSRLQPELDTPRALISLKMTTCGPECAHADRMACTGDNVMEVGAALLRFMEGLGIPTFYAPRDIGVGSAVSAECEAVGWECPLAVALVSKNYAEKTGAAMSTYQEAQLLWDRLQKNHDLKILWVRLDEENKQSWTAVNLGISCQHVIYVDGRSWREAPEDVPTKLADELRTWQQARASKCDP